MPSLTSTFTGGEEQREETDRGEDRAVSVEAVDRSGTGPGRDRAPAREEEGGAPSRLGRLLFGGVLAFMGVNGLRNLDQQIPYAESKGIPMADRLVPATHGMLAAGGVGIMLWRLPTAAAAAVATFLAGVTPVMHDFWNADEDQKQSQMINFMKNVALLGGALVLLRRARRN